MLEPPRLAHRLGDLSGIVESPRTAALSEVARQCDWVIADENSGVHLPVLKLGIPTIAVKLGRYPESRSDMYGFVRDGIVLPPASSIRDVRPDVRSGRHDRCGRCRQPPVMDEFADVVARPIAKLISPPGALHLFAIPQTIGPLERRAIDRTNLRAPADVDTRVGNLYVKQR